MSFNPDLCCDSSSINSGSREELLEALHQCREATDQVDGSNSSNSDEDSETGESEVHFPWIVTCGFQLALWHTVFYCRYSVPPKVLWIGSAIENLCFVSQEKSIEFFSQVFPMERELWKHLPEQCRFFFLDAAEVLLRLALRKPQAFTVKKLVDQYGDHLRLNRAIPLLLHLFFYVEGANTDPSTRKKREREEEPDIDTSRECFVKLYDGDCVASLIQQCCPLGTNGQERLENGVQSEAFSLLKSIFNAALVHDLRKIAVVVLRLGKKNDGDSSHPSKSSDGENHWLPDGGVPLFSRKEDIIHYFFNSFRENADPSISVGKQRFHQIWSAFADTWNDTVGSVVVLSAEVKDSVQYISRTFHIISSNFNASSHSPKDAYALLDSVVAQPPTLLLHFYQRARLQDQMLKCSQSELLFSRQTPEYIMLSRAVKFLRWSTVSSWTSPVVNGLHVFYSRKDAELYWHALKLHESIFHITTDRSSNFSQKRMGENKVYLISVLNDAIDFLNTFHHPKKFQKSCRLNEEGYGSENEWTIHDVLNRYGLLASHLLQFTPQYRIYACLELLYPLLEKLKCYKEAIACLEILLYRPIYALIPISFGGTSEALQWKAVSGSSIAFTIYYRYEKRGKWWHRLALSFSHCKMNEKALQILQQAQKKWQNINNLNEDDKQFIQQSTKPFTFQYENAPAMSETHRKSWLILQMEKRMRMLKGLWSGSSSVNRDLLFFHAAMDFLLQNYISRSHRICIERSIAALHRSLYRWTPLKPHLQQTVTSLRDPRRLQISATSCFNRNKRLWRSIKYPFGSWLPVEEMALHFIIQELNGAYSHEGVSVQNEDLLLPPSSVKGSHVNAEPLWQGLHCEGRWIAILARVLLLECFYYPHCSHEMPNETVESERMGVSIDHYLWLSRFQDAPLDCIVPVMFYYRRRHIISARLRYLECLSDATFISFIEKRIITINHEDALEVMTLTKNSDISSGGVSQGEEMPCSSALAAQDYDNGAVVEPQEKVRSIGIPLIEIVSAMPRKPLLQLLRFMFVENVWEGYSVLSAGFPDLLLWKNVRKTPSPQCGASLQLVEVKSPNDVLSTKQLAVNDLLLRCGFDVCVTEVIAA